MHLVYSWDACSFSAHSIKLPLFGLLAFLVQTFSIVLGPYICTCTTERVLAMVHYTFELVSFLFLFL